jgi:hypothetical protein
MIAKGIKCKRRKSGAQLENLYSARRKVEGEMQKVKL